MPDLRALAREVPLARRSVRWARTVHRKLRTRRLLRRYPDGGFLQCGDVPVFCRFDDPTYEWYDGPSASLEWNIAVLRDLVARTRCDAAIDVGAHFGFFTSAFAQILPVGGLVLAIEPDPVKFRCLERTVERASATGATAVAEQCAAAAERGTITLYRAAGASCLHSYGTRSDAPIGTVDAHPLDDFREVLARRRVGVIKVDVDGAEMDVLRGATQLIAEHDPYLFVEFAPAQLAHAGVDPQRALADLCDGRTAYCLLYNPVRVVRVVEQGFGELQDAIGDGIGDLVICPVGTQGFELLIGSL